MLCYLEGSILLSQERGRLFSGQYSVVTGTRSVASFTRRGFPPVTVCLMATVYILRLLIRLNFVFTAHGTNFMVQCKGGLTCNCKRRPDPARNKVIGNRSKYSKVNTVPEIVTGFETGGVIESYVAYT
jgi:hypothetical protein